MPKITKIHAALLLAAALSAVVAAIPHAFAAAPACDEDNDYCQTPPLVDGYAITEAPKVSFVGTGSLKVEWQPVAGANGYRVSYGKYQAVFDGWPFPMEKDATGTSLTIPLPLPAEAGKPDDTASFAVMARVGKWQHGEISPITELSGSGIFRTTEEGGNGQGEAWKKLVPVIERVAADTALVSWKTLTGASDYGISIDCDGKTEGTWKTFASNAAAERYPVEIPEDAKFCLFTVQATVGENETISQTKFTGNFGLTNGAADFAKRDEEGLDALAANTAGLGKDRPDGWIDAVGQRTEDAVRLVGKLDAIPEADEGTGLRYQKMDFLRTLYTRAAWRLATHDDETKPLNFPEATDADLAKSLGIDEGTITTTIHFNPDEKHLGDLVLVSYLDPKTKKEMSALWESRYGLREVLGERSAVKSVEYSFDPDLNIPHITIIVQPEGGKRYRLFDWIWSVAPTE